MTNTVYKTPYKLSKIAEIALTNKYINGVRSGRLAEEYGIDKKTVLCIVKRNGYADYVSIAKGGVEGKNTEHLEAEIKKWHSTGISQTNVAKKVGVSQSVVSRVLRKYNLKPNYIVANQSGSRNNQWKGGRITNDTGYIMVIVDGFDSMKAKNGYIMEHRYVMASYLERPLYKWETVHHIDGNRANNDIANLQLRVGQHGANQAYACLDCGSNRIKPTKLRNQED